MSIVFSKPSFSPDEHRPVALANKSYPYSSLADSRRFEELIYSLYDTEIKAGLLPQYDDINLLQGVRERGRDCSLHYKGYTTGLIQCKHSINSDERISRPECIREIIKFLLHSLLDNTLLPDPNNFTYFFAVSFGFSEPALELLSNFGKEILKETKLEEWTNNVIAANKALESLAYADVEDRLKNLFSKITVNKIIPQDLDLLLGKPGNENIITSFFEVKIVVDSSALTEKTDEIKEEIKALSENLRPTETPIEELLLQLDHASFQLLNYNNAFENVAESHIDRIETTQLLNWILSPIEAQKKPVVLLAANAGMGKSVILKDLLIKLKAANIPTLGIKADRFYAATVMELSQKLGMDASIEKTIRTIRKSSEKVVILIDQIDALSQSLSAKRDYIDTFNYLVNALCDIDGVRIVISVRTYDLNFDTDLSFYKSNPIISVGLLHISEVKSVLNKIGVPNAIVSPALMELLRTPHHLNVFCKIYTPTLNLHSIKTLYDLYDCLWKIKILNVPKEAPTSGGKCQDAAYSIAKTMYEFQQINIVDSKFESYSAELAYLQSNQILDLQDKQIHFFHQTFYDYVFARQFVESGNDILTYIKDNQQSLYIRSTLKMLATFLREHNHKEYIHILHSVLFSRRYKFHLKLLLINLVGYVEIPSKEETEFVQNKIFRYRQFKNLFLESFNSGQWLNLLLEGKQVDFLLSNENTLRDRIYNYAAKLRPLKKLMAGIVLKRLKNKEDDLNVAYMIFRRHLPEQRQTIVKYLLDLPAFPERNKFVFRILYFLKKWDFEDAFHLYEICKIETANDKIGYYGIMEDVATFDLGWVIKEYRYRLVTQIEQLKPFSDKFNFDHYDEELLKRLLLINNEATFNLIYEVLSLIMQKTSYTSARTALNGNSAFWLFDSARGNAHTGPDALLHMFLDELRDYALKDAAKFIRIYDLLISSDSVTIVQALIHGLLNAPEKYPNQIVTLFEVANDKNAINGSEKVDYWLRKLLAVSYEHFVQKQKDVINKILLAIKPKHEVEIDERDGKKRHWLQFYGYAKYHYISSIPPEQIQNQPALKSEFMMLQRKFINQKSDDTEPGVVRLRGVPAPMSKQAYSKMNDENWIQTFEKYNSETYDPFNDNGSMLEHSRAFAEQVKNNTAKFADLVERLIDEDRVPHAYIIKGIEGLADGGYDPDDLQVLYNRASQLNLDREHTLYLVWKASYFIGHKNANEETANYLMRMAKSHPDPDEIRGDALQQSANCVRGAATIRVVELFYNPQFSDLIFNTISEVTNDSQPAVRVSALVHLAYLMNLDREKTLQIFLKLTAVDNEEIYKYSFWSAQYILNYNFDALIPYLSKALNIPDIEKDLAATLAAAWIGGKKQSLELLNLLTKKSKNAIAVVVYVATENLLHEEPEVRERSKILFERFLCEKDDQIAHQYSVGFLHFKPFDFPALLPMLKKYSASNIAKKAPHYFYEYLIKCVHNHPHACIDLIVNWSKYDKPDISKGSYYDDEPIKIVIGAYNVLRDSKKDRNYKRKALKIFDKMLQDERFRSSANKVIEQVES